MKLQKVLLVISVVLLGHTSLSLAMTRGPDTKPPSTQEKSPPEVTKEAGKTQLSPQRNTKIAPPTVPVKKNR